jgi:hypothetical protein
MAIPLHETVISVSRRFYVGLIISLAIGASSCRHYVMEVPKQPEEERAMKPYADAVWVDGEWEWRKDHHEFKNGYYNPPHRNSAFVPGQWKHSARGYYYTHGRWKKSNKAENDAVNH